MAGRQEPTSLILQELFAEGDDRFLEAVQLSTDPQTIIALVNRWQKDVRPWARELMLRFLAEPMTAHTRFRRITTPGIYPQPAVGSTNALLIKRLYKPAEKAGDDEIVGICMASFDRLIRRKVVKRIRYQADPAARGVFAVQRYETLRANWQSRAFSYPTTCYLRRRAWRYFRRKGFGDPQAYIVSIATMLRQYTEADVALGPNLLDCWGLIHACFGKSEVLTFTVRHANLAPGRGLSELSAAPMFERHWARPQAGTVLMELLLAANCRVVRVWSIQLLRRHHAASIAAVKPDLLLRLLGSPDSDVQQFGADLLINAPGIADWPLETWLQLLKTQNFEALQVVCDAFVKHVAAQRVSLDQAVDLACSTPVPLARLGSKLLQARTINVPADFTSLARLAEVRCEAVGEEITGWALPHLGAAGFYDADVIVRFFDSLLPQVRRTALGWLTPSVPGYSDPALYARLIETPYDDVRFHLIADLSRRSRLPGAGDNGLASIWAGVLLNIHRGGRAKLTALRQISAAIIARPAAAEMLLPVLAVALRSVRDAEARHGLAALVAVVDAQPELTNRAAQEFPEVVLETAGTAGIAETWKKT